jgi:hypothetical protein
VSTGFTERVAAIVLARLREEGVVRPDEQRVRKLARQALQNELLEREARRCRQRRY